MRGLGNYSKKSRQLKKKTINFNGLILLCLNGYKDTDTGDTGRRADSNC